MRAVLAFLLAVFFVVPSSDARFFGRSAGGGPTAITCTISAVTLTGNSFLGGSGTGTTVGTITVTDSGTCGTPSLALTGTDAAHFQITGSSPTWTLKTFGTVSPGSYSITITASATGAAPFPQAESITGTGITGVTLSNNSFTGGSPSGTVVGAVGVTELGGTFGGTLAISGADAASFQLSSSSLPSNLETNGIVPSATYSINIVATQGGVGGSPFTQALTIHGNGGDTLLTTRTPTNVDPQGTTVASGDAIRFGAGFARADVPSGSILKVKDAGGNTLGCQYDARVTWPDGSLAFAEVLCYTARSISTTETLSIYKDGTPAGWPTTLPGSKTKAQLITDLASFTGAQSLNLQLTSVAILSGNSPTAGTVGSGTWDCNVNDLLNPGNNAAVGAVFEVINQGSNAIGFKAYGKYTDDSTPSQAHDHLRCEFQIWLWLNPSTGAIVDVEYMPIWHNCPIIATSQCDRYNFNWALRNGSTVIDSGATPHGAPLVNVSSVNVSGTTATIVTAASHGMVTGDWTCIQGTLYAPINSSILCEGPLQATVTNGTTFTVQVPSATASVGAQGTIEGYGGLSGRMGMLLATADARPRWINGSTITPTLEYGLDQSARHYYSASTMLPAWDSTVVSTTARAVTYLASSITSGAGSATLHSNTGFPCNNQGAFEIYIEQESIGVGNCNNTTTLTLNTRGANSTVATAHSAGAPVTVQDIPYTPFFKANWTAQQVDGVNSSFTHAGPYYFITVVDAPGEAWWLGVTDEISAYSFSNITWKRYARTSALAESYSLAHEYFDDATGRSPVTLSGSYTGLTNVGTSTYYQKPSNFTNVTDWVTAYNADIVFVGLAVGTTAAPNYHDTTHQPHPAVTMYATEGYRYNLDLVFREANASFAWGFAEPDGLSGTNRVRRKPGHASGTIYNNVVLGSATAARDDAWGFMSVVWAATFAPDTFADGSAASEQAYFRDSIKQTVAWVSDLVTNQYTTPMKTGGVWNFPHQGGTASGWGGPWDLRGAYECTDELWLHGYLIAATAQAQRTFSDNTSFNTDLASTARLFANLYTNWHAQGGEAWMLGNSFSNIAGPPFGGGGCQGTASLLQTPLIFPSGWVGNGASALMVFDAIDTVTGWITPAAAPNGSGTQPGYQTTIHTTQLLADTTLTYDPPINGTSNVTLVGAGGEWELYTTSAGGNTYNVTRAIPSAVTGGSSTQAQHNAGEPITDSGVPSITLGDAVVIPTIGQGSSQVIPTGFTADATYCVVAIDSTRPLWAFKLGTCPSGSPIIYSGTSTGFSLGRTVFQAAPLGRSSQISSDPGFDYVKTLNGLDAMIAAGVTDADMAALQTDADGRYGAITALQVPAVNWAARPNYRFVTQ